MRTTIHPQGANKDPSTPSTFSQLHHCQHGKLCTSHRQEREGEPSGYSISFIHSFNSTDLSFLAQVGLLEGRRALITGASRGIGAAIAAAYAEQGAKIVISAEEEQREDLQQVCSTSKS